MHATPSFIAEGFPVLFRAITTPTHQENLVKMEVMRKRRKMSVALVTVGVYDDPYSTRGKDAC